MAILRRNVEFAYSIAKARDNKAYRYGGCWVADDVWRTTDCSGIVTHILDGYDHPIFHDWFYLPGSITDDKKKVSHYPVYPKQLILVRLGSTGPRVRELQKVLNRDYPHYSDLRVDGQHGPQTEAVVKEFQRRAGLTDDGVAGPATLVKLGLPTTTD
jgi:hypothetical protein